MKKPFEIKNSGNGRYLSLFPHRLQGGVFHFFGLKIEGEGKEVHARGPQEGRFLRPRQAHSDRIRVHRRGEKLPEEDPKGHDAVISDEAGICLQVVTADCVPLLFYDPSKGVAGAVHAGWKGSLARISEKTIKALQREFGCQPRNIFVGIGPSIGPCCYEVGKEVSEAIIHHFHQWERFVKKRSTQNPFLDLWEMNRLQLLEQGVPEDQVIISGLCTRCRPDLFFSYRRDGPNAGRMHSGIRLQRESSS